MPEPLRVFYSCAHEDETLRAELKAHLAILEHRGIISSWHDREIVAGTRWSDEISAKLLAAHIIIMLVSADFLATDYCYRVEMAAPRDGKPVTTWANRDDAWVDVCRMVREVCKDMQTAVPDKAVPAAVTQPSKVLEELLVDFSRTWDSYSLNARRIVNWGTQRPRFEALRAYSAAQIAAELTRLASAGAIRTVTSRRGTTLYTAR